MLSRVSSEKLRECDVQDVSLAKTILLALTETEREIIARYYIGHQSAGEIERDLGLEPDYLMKLRKTVRCAYNSERRESAA